MPPRALKHDRWELAQAKAFVSEPPLNTHTAATNTWPILQGSKEQILRQHPDPLRALHEGDVAAVVLRSRLAPTDAAALVRILRKSIKSPDLSPLPPSRGGRKGNTIPQSRWKARGTSLHTLGADLHYSLNHLANFPTAAEHAAYAQGYTQLVESAALVRPFARSTAGCATFRLGGALTRRLIRGQTLPILTASSVCTIRATPSLSTSTRCGRPDGMRERAARADCTNGTRRGASSRVRRRAIGSRTSRPTLYDSDTNFRRSSCCSHRGRRRRVQDRHRLPT